MRTWNDKVDKAMHHVDDFERVYTARGRYSHLRDTHGQQEIAGLGKAAYINLHRRLREAFDAGESYGACSESGSGPAAVEAMKRDPDWWIQSELPALVERIEDDLKCTDH